MRSFWLPQVFAFNPSVRALSRVPARLVTTFWLLIGCGNSQPHHPRVFVSNEKDGTVSAIDEKTFKIVGTVHVGKRPRGLHVSKDKLYVALSGSPIGGPGVDEASLPPPNHGLDGIGVVDLDTLTLERSIASGEDPESFDLVDDHTIVVSNEESARASIVDLPTKSIKKSVAIGREPEGVTVAPDHTAWVTSEGDAKVFVIDPDAGTVRAEIQTGARPRGIAFTNGKGYVTNENDGTITVVDLASHAVVSTIKLPGDKPRPMGIAVADGRVFVSEGRAKAIAVIDPKSDRVANTIPDVGARPWGIGVAPDGLVFTANGPSNDVSVIDPKTNQVIQHIPAGASPWGIAIAP